MTDPPPPDGPTTLLNLCNRHLTTLLDPNLLSSLHSFRGHWSLLLPKLTLLHSHLSSSPLPLSNPLFSHHLLPSLSSTLSSALFLSSTCQSPSPPPSGKLQTQSDLHSLSSLLDLHLRHSHLLLRTRPDSNPHIKNLLTGLQIGGPDLKSSAMESLLAILHGDDNNVLIAVSEGIVPVLVRMLDEPISIEMIESIVDAIAEISTFESSKNALLDEGMLLLNRILRVLESGTGFARERSCVALMALSLFKEFAVAIGSRGGIVALLEVCEAGTAASQGAAAGVLRNLARFEEVREGFMEENAVFVLVELAASGTAVARENAIGCLADLVSGNEDLKVVVAREGVIESVKSYWDVIGVGKEIEPAVELVRNLASCEEVAEVLVVEGFIPRMVLFLRCGVVGVRIAAAEAIYDLGFSSKARREIGECGCIPLLAKMLEGKAVEEREAASKALSRLMLCDLNRKVFKKEEKGILNIVELLDPLTKNVDRKWPITVLSSLARSKKCRKEIVAAGACTLLQKLVDSEVEGAKKLLENLDHGRDRFWDVFS